MKLQFKQNTDDLFDEFYNLEVGMSEAVEQNDRVRFNMLAQEQQLVVEQLEDLGEYI